MNSWVINTAILIWLAGATSGFSQVAVIAHKKVPVDKIKKSELIDFYAYDIKKWRDSQPVIVLDLKPNNKIKSQFYDFLGKSPSRFKSIWLRKMLSGESDPPEAMKSDEEMLKKVAATPGAIGFIDSENVNDKVKTLLVIKEDKE